MTGDYFPNAEMVFREYCLKLLKNKSQREWNQKQNDHDSNRPINVAINKISFVNFSESIIILNFYKSTLYGVLFILSDVLSPLRTEGLSGDIKPLERTVSSGDVRLSGGIGPSEDYRA